MITTTYGYRVPEAGDRAKGASGWMQAIEFDIDRLDGHTHDGIDSSLITIASFSPFTNTLLAANWVADGSAGNYKQTITVPNGITEINDWNVKFIASAPGGMVGEVLYLPYDRQSGTTFEVYCNDNTVACTILYR